MQKIFISSLLLLCVFAAAPTTDISTGLLATNLCWQVASGSVGTDCEKTAAEAGGTAACCKMVIAAGKATTPVADGTSQVGVVAATKGASTNAGAASNHCFKAGGYFTFKTGAAQTNAKEAFADSTTYCGADGKTAPASLVTTPQNFWTVAGTDFSTTATFVALNDGTRRMLATADKEGFAVDTTKPTCTCGTSTMPSDSCAQQTTADVELKCTTIDDGSGSKKCCLATFASPPTTPVQGTNANDIAVDDPTKGAKTNTKYFACYKDTGSFRFKTAATATTADGAAKEAWVSAALFCATDKVTTAIAGATYTHTVSTAVTGATTVGSRKGISGTAATCVCGSANVFTISFMLLAILASLWK